MIWGRAKFAVNRVAMAFRNRGRAANGAQDGGHGPVFSTVRKSNANGKSTPDLTARALRLHNRNREAARRYLRAHAALSRGVSYEP